MRILVTGVTGFIGSLAEWLLVSSYRRRASAYAHPVIPLHAKELQMMTSSPDRTPSSPTKRSGSDQ